MKTSSPSSLVEIGLEAVSTLYERTYPPADARSVEIHRRRDDSTLVVAKIFKDFDYCTRGLPFPQEVDILRALLPPHPTRNIVECLGAHRDTPNRGQATLLLEYCNGGNVEDLADFAQKAGKRIPEPIFWQIFVQLTMALAHCHKYKIIHNDAHNGNWLFNFPNGIKGLPEVKLTDFDRATFDQPNGIVDPSVDVHCLLSYLSRMFQNNSMAAEDGAPPWSRELMYWLGNLITFGSYVPSIEDLKKNMFPIAEKKIQEASSIQLPEWMVTYFKDLQQNQVQGYKVELGKEIPGELENEDTDEDMDRSYDDLYDVSDHKVGDPPEEDGIVW